MNDKIKKPIRRGIILAGGSGTRLHPSTIVTSKQLLPIYDKPLIYYPLSVLMLANIQDILIITAEKDLNAFQTLFGDGSQFGVSLSYAAQHKPEGIAQALLIGEKFLREKPCALILGDNIFYGHGLGTLLSETSQLSNKATIFGYAVEDPERFGVVESENERIISISEKPTYPKSNFAVTGLYFYDGEASSRAKTLKPSIRGELEITDLNLSYLKDEKIDLKKLGRGFAWFDTGTPDALVDASVFIKTIEKMQSQKISCPEEIAWRKKWINDVQLCTLAKKLSKSEYGKYLMKLLEM